MTLKTTREISRAQLLDLIRDPRVLANLPVLGPNDRLLIAARVVPKEALAYYLGEYPEYLIPWLVKHKKLMESEDYVWALASNRNRPIAGKKVLGRPPVPHAGKSQVTLRIFNRDRHLLWEAAANYELTGSDGEARGLWHLCRFLRTPRILRLWKLHTERPHYKLTELSQ